MIGNTAISVGATNPMGAAAKPPMGPLANIVSRIEEYIRDADEIAGKLHQHADAVSGPVPVEAATGASGAPDQPTSLIDQIFQRLELFERSFSNLVVAADRNTTLA